MTGKELDIYFAGLIDGEGSIRIRKSLRRRQPSYVEVVDIGMVGGKYIFELAKKEYGGSIYFAIIKKQKNRRKIDRWTITTKMANKFLKRIYPYLILKRRQAEICFKLRDLINKNEFIRRPNGTYLQLNQDEVDKREYLFIELKKIHSEKK